MFEPIVVRPYDPRWPFLFEELRAPIVRGLGAMVVAVVHVGSTAVPGLAAKPVVDLDAVLRSAQLVPEAIARLAELGYVHEGDLGITGREAFRWPATSPRHHLYVLAYTSPVHQRHIRFRDYLRRHPDVASWYGAHKLAFAVRYRDDRDAYSIAKSPLIEEIMRRADAENDLAGGAFMRGRTRVSSMNYLRR